MTPDVAPALILLVEDFADAREMYHDYLTFSGFRVETASDGHEAVEKARALLPDLILMDLSDPATRHLTIVALSAHALSVAEIRHGGAACDGFIAKPCLPPDLVVQITGFLKLHANTAVPDGNTERIQ
jgi:two-component system cell cycle response regulator DivK